MGLATEVRGRARFVLGPLIGILCVSYFAYHVVQGDRGLSAWVQLKQEVTIAQAKQSEIAVERDKWRHQVSLLRSETLDVDMLEERARVMLDYGMPNELIILIEQ